MQNILLKKCAHQHKINIVAAFLLPMYNLNRLRKAENSRDKKRGDEKN
ncbi:Hypothetical protein ETEE_1171 [Edwardsiella anguillarum ET080813]|uniref:Uncharacterized protein n=1 Tax=Edwardsiella anguillarum ET080813 TaxID=667120 RepID=A0A076LLL1_9GAMM|nr:Hypothetical protein ETEE_1171 [Edwardsiella anguillarum ET080813]